MRASTNIDLKNRKAYELTDFRGVDFSSPVSKVSPTRATTMRNMICEGGINHKRPGWERLFQISNGQIYGIFPYKDHMLVHCGDRIFKVTYSNTKGYVAESKMVISEEVPTGANLSQGFYQDGFLYIIGCGYFLRWDGKSLKRVFDNAYIPTTTISIDADAVTDTVRATLDDVNLLTGWRKNKMHTSSDLTLENYVWTVDSGSIGCIDTNSTVVGNYFPVTVTIDTLYDNELVRIVLKTPENDYTNVQAKVGNLTAQYIRKVRMERTTIKVAQSDGTSHEETSVVAVLGVDVVIKGTTGENIQETDVLGYVDYAKGKIHLGKMFYFGEKAEYKDTPKFTITAPTAGEDNIEVLFYRMDYDQYNNLYTGIDACKFGTVFGVNGQNDTLFLSGNPYNPNMEYHSAPGDFTYFPDRNYTVYGSTDVPIVGYGRVSDTVLAVFKKENYKEPTVYYRTGEYKTIDGNLQEIYPITAGAMGKGIVSRHGCAYFHGDPLILTSEGVYGLSLGSNIAVNERYAKERSANIRKKLVKANLENAVGIVYGDRYYLATGNECYVADSRNKFSQNDSYGYEWWYWDNIPARVWAVVDGELWFGTEDGSVCRFDDQYTDRTHISTKAGDLSIDVTIGRITFKQSLPIRDGMPFRWLTDNIYYVVADECTVSNGMILSTEEEIMHIHDGTEVYAKEVGSSGLTQNTKYYICNIDRGELTYQLRDKSGNVISLASGGFSIHGKISQKTLYVRDCDDTGKTFRLAAYAGGPALTLSYYLSSTPSNPLAIVTDAQNVVAEWCTPALDFGTNMHVKTLLRMTIAAEPVPHGKVVFGYETRTASRMMARMVDAQSVGGFSLEDFSFEDFSFNTDFAGSYTVRCNERNFNYIMFHIKSDSATDCAVSGLSVLYKINRSNKGVK